MGLTEYVTFFVHTLYQISLAVSGVEGRAEVSVTDPRISL
jgi:hypothetical protein